MTEKLNILFVDDEKQILTSLGAMFKKQYGVFTATSGSNALDIIDNHSIQIIVSDQRMSDDLNPPPNFIFILIFNKLRHFLDHQFGDRK
jgi:DNA-binding NtrC family response regulator